MLNYLITGANRGIGLELTRQLTARGDHVIATTRNPNNADTLRTLPNTTIEQLDVTDPLSINALAARFHDQIDSPIDTLINNAGIQTLDMTLAEVTADTMLENYRTNTLGPLLLTRALLPHLARSARIINISTNLASITNTPNDPPGGFYAYRASKAALNMLTAALAIELDRIVTAIHPGWVQTDMGGPEAPLVPHESAAGIIHVIDSLKPTDSGAFLDYRGNTMPW